MIRPAMHHIKKYILWLIITTCNLYVTGAAQDIPSNFFTQDEYEHYMQLIKQISPKVHAQLTGCAQELGEPCLEKSENNRSYVAPGTSLSNGHPTIVLASLRNQSEAQQKEILKHLIDRYTAIKNTLPITSTEQEDILTIIQDIAPELHSQLINLNKKVIHPYTQKQLIHTVKDHIRRNYDSGLAVNVCPFDGFPIIWIDQDSFIDNPDPQEQFKAAIAHELGHYVLQHLQNNQKTLNPVFKELRKAYSRIQEFEADRSMVLDFNIPSSLAIENAKTLQMQEDPSTKTFKSSHPLWADRIKHIESLLPEVELKQAHKQGRKIFDWQRLAHEYVSNNE